MAEVDPITDKRNEGFDFYEEDEYDRAIEIFTELIEQNKDNVDLERYLKRKYDWHFYRGMSYKGKNDNDAAIKDFTICIETEAGGYGVFIERGLIYYKKNDLDNAIKDFAEAMKLSASTFKDIPENLKTPEWCLMAVKKNGNNLKYVPENLKTEEMCLIAVKANSFNLKYVPENLKTEEAKWLCLAALENLDRVREEGYEEGQFAGHDEGYDEGKSEGREEVFALWESGISLEEAKEKLED